MTISAGTRRGTPELIEFIKMAKSYSEIYPVLTAWKRTLWEQFDFVAFDQMAKALADAPELEGTTFKQNVASILKWRQEHLEIYKVDHENFEIQISYAFPVGPPFAHIVSAENRMIVACVIAALKGLDETYLYGEYCYFKKAHELIWAAGKYSWAALEGREIKIYIEDYATPLKSGAVKRPALSFV